jgi:hypothetical protein
MKIRDKLEISTAKAREKQKEIEEGAKIAKTIDVLRETKAREESSLRKFRDESLKRIQEEINAKIMEKKLLTEDIEGLRATHGALKQKVEDINNKIINL